MAQILEWVLPVVGIVVVLAAIAYVRFARHWSDSAEVQHRFGGLE